MKGRKFMAKRFGFTLAEVLITLGIIGVVAAMTIPTVLNNASDQQFKTGFKKILSTLNQAVTMNVALDNTDFGDMNVTTTTANSLSLYNLFNSRMNVVKTATTSAAAGINLPDDANYTVFFSDGMALSFKQSATGCTTAAPCKALVDVNGTKKPNTQATTDTTQIKDQYGVIFSKQQVVPNNATARAILFN